MSKLDLTLRTLYLITEAMPKPKTFLFDTFFGDREVTDQISIDIEFQNGRRYIAPFVDRYLDGEAMPKDTFSGRNFKPYSIAPKHIFTADELTFERVAGENPYSKIDPETKARVKITKALTVQSEQIARRWEAMAVDVLYNLKLTVEGPGVKDEVKYYDKSATEHHINATIAWDQPNADPISDIKTVLQEITKVGGTRPNSIVLDPIAADLFVKNEKVKELMNLRNAYFGDIRPEVAGVNGASYIGTLTGLGIDIFEYQEYYDYIDNSGVLQTKGIIPENTALFAPVGNLVKFGAESSITNGLMTGIMIPRKFENERNDTIEISTISKPVLIPLNSKSLKVLKVK